MSDTTQISGVSSRYATALYDLAQESGRVEMVEKHLAALSEALDGSDDLVALVASPLYSRAEQGRAMAAICDAMKIGAPTRNLIALMAEKRRLFTLRDVIRDFNAILADARGVVSAEVISARPLNKTQRKALETALAKATGAKIALEVGVDEALIGGLVVKVGSRMIDSSIRSKLSQLQTVMKEAGI